MTNDPIFQRNVIFLKNSLSLNILVFLKIPISKKKLGI